MNKIKFNIYNIVENGLISNPKLGEGRMIPALVLKSEKDQKLKELLKIHSESPPGDVIVTWAYSISNIYKPKVWYLKIDFSQPMELSFQIKFDLDVYYPLIHAIFKARCLYLRVGEKGEKISSTMDGIITVEVPKTNMEEKWAYTLNSILKKKFRKEGIPNKNIKEAINIQLKHMDEILLGRMKSS